MQLRAAGMNRQHPFGLQLMQRRMQRAPADAELAAPLAHAGKGGGELAMLNRLTQKRRELAGL
jgi:hypothetical protein